MTLPAREGDAVGAVRQAYARRTRVYDPLDPAVLLPRQEVERVVAEILKAGRGAATGAYRVLEVGCGTGGNLAMLIRLGLDPANLVGNELLPDRLALARERLPAGVTLLGGDATRLIPPGGPFDMVLQSLVFSSILDDGAQAELAARLWQLVKPGGGLLWYDFTFDNPANPDVRGVTYRRIRDLFPEGQFRSWRVTLAPPLARRVTRLHPGLYGLLNLLPFLRTHLICWIGRPVIDRGGTDVD